MSPARRHLAPTLSSGRAGGFPSRIRASSCESPIEAARVVGDASSVGAALGVDRAAQGHARRGAGRQAQGPALVSAQQRLPGDLSGRKDRGLRSSARHQCARLFERTSPPKALPPRARSSRPSIREARVTERYSSAPSSPRSVATGFDGIIRLAPALPSTWSVSGTVFVQGQSKVHVQFQNGALAFGVLEAGIRPANSSLRGATRRIRVALVEWCTSMQPTCNSEHHLEK